MLPIFFLVVVSGAMCLNVSELGVNKTLERPVALSKKKLGRELISQPILEAIYEHKPVKIDEIMKSVEGKEKYLNGSSRQKVIIENYFNMKKKTEMKLLRQKVNFIKILNDNSIDQRNSNDRARETKQMRELAKEIVAKASFAKLDIIDLFQKSVGIEEATIDAILMAESNSRAIDLVIWKEQVAENWGKAIARSKDPRKKVVAIETMLQDIKIDVYWDLSTNPKVTDSAGDYNLLNSITDANENIQPETILRRKFHSIVDATLASLNNLRLVRNKNSIVRYIADKEAAEVKKLGLQAFEALCSISIVKLCSTFLG